MRNRNHLMLYLSIIAFIIIVNSINAFTYTSGNKWKPTSMPIIYKIKMSGAPSGAVTAIDLSFSTWQSAANDWIRFTNFGYTTAGFVQDDINSLSWGYAFGAIAASANWDYFPITEKDIVFESSLNWSTSSSPPSGYYDVQNIATHEIGHWLRLQDLYDPGDTEITMYGYASTGETKKRTLHSDDIAGVQYIYRYIYVPDDYSTISSAINGAQSGQDIKVSAGTYNENIAMKSSVDVDGAGKYSTTINGTVTWQNRNSAKLKDLTVNDRITVNSGSYNKVENVQAKKRIVLNYGSDHEIKNVTANHYDSYGIYALDTDPYIDNFIYDTRYPMGIYGSSGAYLDIYDGQLEDKSRGVMLYGNSDATLSSTEFCLNGFDIYAYSGCYAMAYSCVWSGNPQYKTYGDVDWSPVSYDYCGMYKSVVAQQQPASAVNLASLENEPGWDKYIQALSDYNAIKELLRSDTLSSRENVPEKYGSEYESVINLFKQIVSEYPGSLVSIKAISRIADCYWNLSQPEMVFDYVNVVLDNSIYDSLRPYALKELVSYYLSKNDNDQALKVIDEVLALSIDDQLTGETLFSKGIVYRYYEEDRPKAADIFQQVIALYPDSPLILTAQAELEDMGVEYEAGDSTSTEVADGQLVIQTYPNPFNPVATIRFGLPEEGYVTLKVYDVLGREAATLVNGYVEAGWQMIVWNGKTADGREVPSGIYIARLVTPATARSIKLVLLR